MITRREILRRLALGGLVSPLLLRRARGEIVTGGSQALYSVSFGASRPAAFSVACWFKAAAAPGTSNSYLWHIGNSTAYPNDRGDVLQCWGNSIAGNRNRAVLHRTGTTYSTYGTAGGGALNAWTHLATVYDGSGLLVYENGALLGSRLSASITAAQPADWVLTLGAETLGAGGYLPSGFKLSGVGYWPIALTAPDAASLAKGAPPYRVRSSELAFCAMGFRSANAMKGITASATGVTFDDDNPRFYL